MFKPWLLRHKGQSSWTKFYGITNLTNPVHTIYTIHVYFFHDMVDFCISLCTVMCMLGLHLNMNAYEKSRKDAILCWIQHKSYYSQINPSSAQGTFISKLPRSWLTWQTICSQRNKLFLKKKNDLNEYNTRQGKLYVLDGVVIRIRWQM